MDDAVIDMVSIPTVDAFASSYARAFMSDDPREVAALMTEDFAAITSGQPPIVGRAAVQDAVATDMSAMEIVSLSFEIVEHEVAGDIAWAWGSATGVVREHGSAADIPVAGHFLWVLEWTGDGWRIRCDGAHESSAE